MKIKQHISPIVFVVPFVVMFLVISVAMFAATSGTDVRSHASNDRQAQCISACTQLGGNEASCESVCPSVLNGTMYCNEAARVVGVSSAVFMNACDSISPLTASCAQSCKNIFTGKGNASLQTACVGVCKEVSTGEKSCQQSCSTFAGGPNGAANVSMCLSACKTFAVKKPLTCWDRVAGSTNYYWPDGCRGNPLAKACVQTPKKLTESEVVEYKNWLNSGRPSIAGCTNTTTVPLMNCVEKCSTVDAQLQPTCQNICQKINTGSVSCTAACTGVGGGQYDRLCKATLCKEVR